MIVRKVCGEYIRRKRRGWATGIC